MEAPRNTRSLLAIAVLAMIVLAHPSQCFTGFLYRTLNKAAQKPEECQMPPSPQVERLLSSQKGVHETFYQFRPLLDTVQTLERFRKNHGMMVDLHYSYLNGSRPQCPATPERGLAWNPCPVTWKLNYDANRVPRTLVEAECLHCPFCGQLIPGDITAGCASVKYYVKVARRLARCDSTGHYTYVQVWEPVTVGCACRSGVNTRPDRDLDLIKSG